MWLSAIHPSIDSATAHEGPTVVLETLVFPHRAPNHSPLRDPSFCDTTATLPALVRAASSDRLSFALVKLARCYHEQHAAE